MAKHFSVCPIRNVTSDDPAWHLPLKLGASLYFDEVSKVFEETGFNLLVPNFYTQEEVEALKKTRYGLVRYSECEERDNRDEDKESDRLLYPLYLGLKLIRPTAGKYQVLHYDMAQTLPRLPRGWRNDRGTLLSDCESLNTIRWKDLQELQVLAPCVLSTLSTAGNPIAQAVQSMEVGYRAEFSNVRHLLWVVGLDALFTSTEWENQGARVAVQRVEDFLGCGFEIYSENRADFESIDLKLPRTTLSETLQDVYKLRNQFAHGGWPDKAWAGKVCRRSANGLEDIYYATTLSEAASAILRGCLKKILADPALTAMFKDKAKMNAHFSRFVRKRKAPATP
jgi:hypothetical protein